jgi:methylated-DNA-protein-cysteine methyltransferase-like protein
MMIKKSPTDASTSPYEQFRTTVHEFVRHIPQGKVMTYGKIATYLPKPEGIDSLAFKRIRARWVGYAMKSCPADVPWWRVVNAKGQISLRIGHGPHIQRQILKEEGVELDEDARISLEDHLWDPT